jgi:2-iminobutanoate/2-iminopropanoate deaminase
MADKQAIHTPNAPAAIGPYSQAVRCGDLVFLSGQIPLDPSTMEMVEGDIEAQTVQVLKNLSAVAKEAGADLDSILKLTIYLIDLGDFSVVNETMKRYFQQPYPARATVQVSALPRGSAVEIDAILSSPGNDA